MNKNTISTKIEGTKPKTIPSVTKVSTTNQPKEVVKIQNNKPANQADKNRKDIPDSQKAQQDNKTNVQQSRALKNQMENPGINENVQHIQSNNSSSNLPKDVIYAHKTEETKQIEEEQKQLQIDPTLENSDHQNSSSAIMRPQTGSKINTQAKAKTIQTVNIQHQIRSSTASTLVSSEYPSKLKNTTIKQDTSLNMQQREQKSQPSITPVKNQSSTKQLPNQSASSNLQSISEKKQPTPLSKNTTIQSKQKVDININQNTQPKQKQPSEEQKDNSHSIEAIIEKATITITTNKYKFFETFDDPIIEKIYIFLELKDYIKLATVSRKARDIIPKVIKLQDYKHLFEYEHTEGYYMNEFQQQCQQIYQNSDMYKKLIENQLDEINTSLEEFNKKQIINKAIIQDILLVSVNHFMKTNKKKEDIIEFILKKGVQNIFKPLSFSYIKPSTGKLIYPQFPYSASPTPLNLLIRQISRYLDMQQRIKYPIEKQKVGVHERRQKTYYEYFHRKKDQFILKYSRPIYCMKSTSNVFNYLNKNIIQMIIPFLNQKELLSIRLTSKPMNELIKQGVTNIISLLSSQRLSELHTLNISEEQAKTALYLKHFAIFSWTLRGMISNEYLHQEKMLQTLFFTLCQAFLRESLNWEELFTKKAKYEYFYIDHDFNNVKADKLSIIEETLATFTDEKVEKQNNQPAVALQKYLKGLQLYLKLKLNRQLIAEIQAKYDNKIEVFDRKIYQYQKQYRLNSEELDGLIVNTKNPHFHLIGKCKGMNPTNLFQI